MIAYSLQCTGQEIIATVRLFQAGSTRGVPYTLIAVHLFAPYASVAARVRELAYAGILLVTDGGVRAVEVVGT